ncbi:GatB/YqeY domain-containing protein [Lojkania enalia]|uniref:Altered inheritance of mitochondria protein 41 n=1 Tax=Lojkania enalia TaxID=147567 RepID=A0A9P4K944_9PLEO|nr:GatB/YqeY domain-containing protein [Didymosphaeria enalia]
MAVFRLARPSALLKPSTFTRTLRTTASLADAPQPIVLPRLKEDLKTAMRSKDKQRLDVLRTLLASITNASKTPSPIATDYHLSKLLLKQITASQKAIQEFQAAKRDDLIEKERGQVEVLEGYMKEIPTMEVEEMKQIIKDAIEELGDEARFGSVMKKVKQAVAGRPADMTLAANTIKISLKK